MPNQVFSRAASGDFDAYYGRYLDCLPEGDLVAILEEQTSTLGTLLSTVRESGAGYAYAPGKWTIREVVGHLTDTERVFAYRATAFSRNDSQPLPGFDQAAWNPHGRYDDRTLADLVEEWVATRRSTVALLRWMPEEALARRGSASGFDITVLALLSIPPGHVNHHIRQLRDQYRVTG